MWEAGSGKRETGSRSNELLLAAVGNNAGWCDAVCRARGVPGRFSEHLWINERPTPPYYPNIITLTPHSDARARELDETIERVRTATSGDLSVKDSFADTDLSASGLRVLFDAQWIVRDAALAAPAPSPAGVAWSIATSAADLRRWKQAWDDEILETDPVFAPALLGDEDIAFMVAHRDGAVVAGAIANKSAGVVGLSNVFAPADEKRAFWAGCIAAGTAWAPGIPIVGYESGAELAMALALGFERLGPLRIWVATS